MNTQNTPEWTQTPPTDQGEYWHWNGDEDSAPLPMFVLWSGTTGKCFVSRGQLGIEHAVDCDQYGGWWMPLYAPALPGRQGDKRAGPHYVLLGRNSNGTPCAALAVYAASAGLDDIRANALLMLHDAGHIEVKKATAIYWPGL